MRSNITLRHIRSLRVTDFLFTILIDLIHKSNTENYLERGLTQMKKSAFDIFRVEPDKVKSVPLKEFVKPSVEGLCFTYFPNRVKKQNEHGEE
jgi:hypothetical protein